MGYNQKAKFIKNSPLPCWKGYERVPGTARGAKGSCRKSSPAKLDLTKKSGFGPRAAKGNDDQSKELAKSRYEMGQYKTDPTKRNKKSPVKAKDERVKIGGKMYPKGYTKKDVKFLKKQREDVVRYKDLDAKGKAIWKKQGKPIPKSPVKVTQKGGGTKKVCLPKAKIASMSKAEKSKVVRAKRAAGAKGKYRRSSKSNVTGTSSGGSLKTWVKQDWRQVGNPSKKCGEK